MGRPAGEETRTLGAEDVDPWWFPDTVTAHAIRDEQSEGFGGQGQCGCSSDVNPSTITVASHGQAPPTAGPVARVLLSTPSLQTWRLRPREVPELAPWALHSRAVPASLSCALTGSQPARGALTHGCSPGNPGAGDTE